jgi:peptidoglycan-N-acetylglucosamine deacetylase
VRSFLKQHDYRNGYVTVDASDWYVHSRLQQRLAKDPEADTAPYRDFYLKHLLNRANYYNDLAMQTLGRSVRHTILIHHNELNGLFLADVLEMFRKNNWELIDADVAFADPVFQEQPNNVPAGESIIWALAKAAGNKSLRYPGEDGDYEKPEMDRLAL